MPQLFYKKFIFIPELSIHPIITGFYHIYFHECIKNTPPCVYYLALKFHNFL